MLLIPAIDLRGGQCVRLHQGDFGAETLYRQDAEELLQRYRDLGAPWLHVVDLDGARDGVPTNLPLIARLARGCSMRLQVGGGMRSAYVIAAALSVGVSRVVIGSAAVLEPMTVIGWLKRFGSEHLCLAFDVRLDAEGEPRVHTHGWTQKAGITLWHAVRAYQPHKLRHVLCTDIERDGALAGPNLDLYERACHRFPDLAWQASGGVRHAQDLQALAQRGVAAAVSGRALLENRIQPQELRRFWPNVLSPA